MSSEYERELIAKFGLDAENEASMIAEVVLSVIRDRSISSLYGFQAFQQGRFPSVSEVFNSFYSQRVVSDLERHAKKASRQPLYSGAGELLGQLCRLLLVCKERGVLAPYITKANERLAQLEIKTTFMSDGDYVRHLRNAIMHCRYEVQVDPDDFLRTQLVFLDLRNGGNEISGMITVSPEQLNETLNILIDDICLRYLTDIGWSFDYPMQDDCKAEYN